MSEINIRKDYNMDIERLQKLAGIITEGRPGRKQVTKMLHGTSSKFISSIKKYGLLPSTGETPGYGSATAVHHRSYGGIYLTPDLAQAVSAAHDVTDQTNKADGTNKYEPVIVVVQLVEGSAGLDEDEIVLQMLEIYNVSKDESGFAADVLSELRPHKVPSGDVPVLYALFKYLRKVNPTNEDFARNLDLRNRILGDSEFRILATKLIESVKAGSDEFAAVRVYDRPIGWSGKTRILDIVGEDDPVLYEL